MTREELKKIQPILNAFAEGKVIQVCNPSGHWEDRVHDLKLLTLVEHPEWYRIKPETKYRPFGNVEECWQEMQKHQPFGWVLFLDDNANLRFRACISAVYNTNVEISDRPQYDFKDAFGIFTFADGTPFGKKEEEK